MGLITEDEVAMIKHVENKSTEELVPIMAEVWRYILLYINTINHHLIYNIQHGLYYAGLYLELMQKLARVDALQKVLVLIHDMLDGTFIIICFIM